MLISLNDFCMREFGDVYHNIWRHITNKHKIILVDGYKFDISTGAFVPEQTRSGGISTKKEYDIRLLLSKPKYIN